MKIEPYVKVLGKFCLMLSLLSWFLACGAFAQTFNMAMESDFSAWTSCVLPACQPGGSGIPTKVDISETGTTWPANSLRIAVTGPQWTNLLVYDKVGASTATYFNSDFWAYIPSTIEIGTYQALEYDIFQFLSPYRFMWGSECVLNAYWQIWDELHQQWINTTQPCEMNKPDWYHIQWWVHRVDGDTSCDGYPCMYFDMLGVNGVYTQLASKEPAGPIPAGWSNNSGLNFQLDISGEKPSATISEYIQRVNFTELSN